MEKRKDMECHGTYETERTTIRASDIDLVLLEVPDSGFAELWLGKRLFSRRVGHDLAITLQISRCGNKLGRSGCCLGGSNGERDYERFESGSLHNGGEAEKMF